MLLPVLETLDKLGGSGTKDEMDEITIDLMGLKPEQMAVEFPSDAQQKGSKVVHRLAWARTYLKKFGATDNSRRGVWTLEPPGRKYLEMPREEAATALRNADAEVRKQARLEKAASALSGTDAEDPDS